MKLSKKKQDQKKKRRAQREEKRKRYAAMEAWSRDRAWANRKALRRNRVGVVSHPHGQCGNAGCARCTNGLNATPRGCCFCLSQKPTRPEH